MKDNYRFYIEVISLAACLMAIFIVCITFDLAGYHPNPEIVLFMRILFLIVSAFFFILTFCGLFSLWLYERRRENEKA
jgi:antibiotic biosynthesis monooxygenase (ABM) superfamily enzyme